jgi:hypothetical protein
MNTKYIAIVAVMAATLVGTTVITADSALATKYGKNQATSQANACGNDKLPMYVFCQNINSQVQGEENAVALDGVQQSGEEHKDKKDGGHDKDKDW